MASQIKSGALISYLSVIINIAAGLLYTPWMINEIGREEYGLYSLALVFISYFLIDFGLGSAISTYVSKAIAKNDSEGVKDIIGSCYKIYFLISLIIAICLSCSYLFLANIFVSFDAHQLQQFKIIYCIVGACSIISFPFMPLNGIIVAHEKIFVLKIIELIQKLTCISLIVVCLLNGLGLYALVFVNGLCSVLVAFAKFMYVHRKLHVSLEIRRKIDKSILKSISSFSVWVFILSIAERLIVSIQPTIMGIHSGAAAIAIFAIAVTMEGYVWTFANCINGLFIPKVSKFVAQGLSKEEITSTMIKVGRLQLYFIGLLILGLVSFGQPFVHLWVGDKFMKSYLCIVLLVMPNIILSTEEIANTLLWVENKVKYRTLIYIIAGSVSCLIGYFMSERFEAQGCAMAVFIALTIVIISLNIIYNQKLHLNIYRFFKECHLKILPVMLIPVVASFIYRSFFTINTWPHLILCVVVFSVSEFGLLFFFSFNSYEKSLLKLKK